MLEAITAEDTSKDDEDLVGKEENIEEERDEEREEGKEEEREETPERANSVQRNYVTLNDEISMQLEQRKRVMSRESATGHCYLPLII